jgi:hypothetical protein
MNNYRNFLIAAGFATAMSATLMPSLAQAEAYTLVILEAPSEFAKRADKGDAGMSYWKAYADFGKAAGEAGIMRGGAALDGPQSAASVGKSGIAAAAASDGLIFGGYFQIDVENLDAAKEWAMRLPAAFTGRVDIFVNIPGPAMCVAGKPEPIRKEPIQCST